MAEFVLEAGVFGECLQGRQGPLDDGGELFCGHAVPVLRVAAAIVADGMARLPVESVHHRGADAGVVLGGEECVDIRRHDDLLDD